MNNEDSDVKTKSIRCTAIVLAAGTGSRMKAKMPKQFMELCGKPLIYYALHVVEESNVIDDCILVTAREDLGKMRTEIVERYGFQKVKAIIAGGSERCFSVANAVRCVGENCGADGDSASHYLFIHDGARPFLSEEILQRTLEGVMKSGACVAAMPSKDTVKIADENEFAASTPERKKVWCIQTPQVFEFQLIAGACESFLKAVSEAGYDPNDDGHGKLPAGLMVTDDASLIEQYTSAKVKLVEGSYYNMKVTTPDDLVVAEAFLRLRDFA